MHDLLCIGDMKDLTILFDLRVKVIMEDVSREDPYYLCTWHTFLPSEVILSLILPDRAFIKCVQ